MFKRLRPVIKGLSWRAFAAFDTMAITAAVMFLRTGHINSTVWAVAGSIVGMELFSKTFLFAVHEKLWERDAVAVPVPDVVEPAEALSYDERLEDLLAHLDNQFAANRRGELR